MSYTGRNEELYYSSPEEVVTKGNFLPGDVRSDWNNSNEAELDEYIISTLIIVKDIIDRDRNINFSNEKNGVPKVIHLAATMMGFFLTKDSSDTQDSYIKNNEEVRIYKAAKLMDENTRALLDIIPKRSVDGLIQNSIRFKAARTGTREYL
jgi:hypothetical protein